MKKIMFIFKSFFFSIFILSLFNAMSVILNIYIPLNIYTVMIVCFFGVPGLLLLIGIIFMF